MNSFRTELKVVSAARQHGLNTRFLTLGSCFSEAIGHRLNTMKFPTAVNPFGIIYNPVSIHRVLGYTLDQTAPPPYTYLFQNEIHLNHDLHSCYSATTRDNLERRINEQIQQVHEELSRTDVVMLTLGTAWVYVLNGHDHIVANCHKRPSRDFEKRLLSVDDIVTSFSELYTRLKKINPGLHTILTVSPVRHLRDTIPLNSVSKAVLRMACHRIATEFGGVDYFPAYEIMIDDLRDYRFYDRDMIHPSSVAEDYIWEQFAECYLDDDARQFMKKWTKIQAALHHKPFHVKSPGHQNFVKEMLNKLQDVQSIVNVDAEIKTIQAQLDPSSHENIDS